MTYKRFTIGKKKGHWYIRDNLEDIYHRDMSLPNDVANVCYVLNELSEENEQLKREIEILNEEILQHKAVIDRRWKEYVKRIDGDVE